MRGMRRTLSRSLLALAAASLLGAGCTKHGTSIEFKPERLERESHWIGVSSIPLVRQTTRSNCGAAALAMLLGFWGHPMTLAEVAGGMPTSFETDALKAGDLRDFARKQGLQAFLVTGEIADLEKQLRKKHPVLVGVLKPGRGKRRLSHYELVVGFDPAAQRVVLLDPAAGWREDSVAGFMAEWEPAGRLSLIAFPAEPSPAAPAVE